MRSPSSRRNATPNAVFPDDAKRIRRPRPGSRGSVTAEFAAVIPAVLVVLLACLAGLQVAGIQLRLQDASADAARALSRGEPEYAVAAGLSRAVPGAHLSVEHRGELVCAHSSARAPSGIVALTGLTVRASGCARSGGL